jgi:translation initiation factor 6 (eIF-6)
MELKVLKSFRDKEDAKKNYKVGEAIKIDSLDRINDLVSRGICIITAETKDESVSVNKIKFQEKEFELKAVKEALAAIGITVAANAGATSINKKLSELTEEQTKTLAEILCKE